MKHQDIASWRLRTQQIAHASFHRPGDVVGWLGAVQAQDYLGSLWAIGSRMRDATEVAVEGAIAERTIVRTWPMRGTLHFVAAADIRWMLELMTPRVIARAASRFRQLELDDATFARGQDAVVRALGGGKQLTRSALYEVLEAAGISAAGQRGIHVLSWLAQHRVICFGAREGKQPTFALLDEWVPAAKRLERDEALAELARRYFTGHGPATVQDLMWWSGLPAADARAGLEAAASHLAHEQVDGQRYWMSPDAPEAPTGSPAVHLLAPFDEYLLGYRDRSAVLDRRYSTNVNPGNNGVFSPTIVSAGRVVGTWKRVVKKNEVVITPYPFTTLDDIEMDGFAAAADRYARFLGLPATVQPAVPPSDQSLIA